jgi:Tfp pilus assembly protein FimV
VAGDVDTLGFLADMYVEIGDLERASQLYDRVLAGIHDDDVSNPYMSWDC